MDRLKRSHFPRDLTGQIHLSQFDAIRAIDADLARSTLEDRRVDTLVDQSIAATRDASLREQHPPRTKEDMMPVTVAELMAAARSAVPDISHEEARKLLDAGRALPVDVRDAAEVESSGRIKGALHVSRGHLEFKADPGSPVHEAALDRELTILVYCNSGGRAALAAKTLKDMGFRDVRNLGGFRDWVAAGGAVER
jgi:rhodanese-related sulfurtransferase